jgi:hypothetical protein
MNRERLTIIGVVLLIIVLLIISLGYGRLR